MMGDTAQQSLGVLKAALAGEFLFFTTPSRPTAG